MQNLPNEVIKMIKEASIAFMAKRCGKAEAFIEQQIESGNEGVCAQFQQLFNAGVETIHSIEA